MGSIFYFYLNEQVPPFKDDFLEAINVNQPTATEAEVRVIAQVVLMQLRVITQVVLLQLRVIAQVVPMQLRVIATSNIWMTKTIV